MPELPEVETMRRGLLPIVGRRIQSVTTPPCSCKPISIKPSMIEIASELIGQKVQDISRIGKRVLIETNLWALVLQPKMTGLATLGDVPDPGHVRLLIQLSGRPKLCTQFWDRRGLGTVEMIAKDQVHSQLVEGRLGPDALAITEDEFHHRLTVTRREVKVALLDQKILAGVGNLYASEMLFAARINPQLPASQLSKRQTKKLHQVMLKILNTAILHEGSTLSDGTYRNALNEAAGYQNEHQVYDREDETCPGCHKRAIIRIVQAQRSTFYCPSCQK
ncbi:MAG: DNA-formamidopyrimidine glycosylase [Pirellulales bacterium]